MICLFCIMVMAVYIEYNLHYIFHRVIQHMEFIEDWILRELTVFSIMTCLSLKRLTFTGLGEQQELGLLELQSRFAT